MRKKFLAAEWKNLIMANYIVEPDLLKEFIPNKTELDLFNGDVYVSLVGFMFLNTKVKGFSIPWHTNFEEVNLRFYVRYKDNGEWKRGVSFIDEIVPKPTISFIANTIYHEKYRCLRMKHKQEIKDNLQYLTYSWQFGANENKISATTDIKSIPLVNGSKEEFVAEHYWGYSKYNDRTTFEYQVTHPKWNIFPVKDYLIDCDFGKLYGNRFEFLKNIKPDSVFVAEGSSIEVYNKRKL
ncbi:MAG: DUF2071 domain-containing protein [Sphingobacteriales bacterium]|nr:DUF2071 domain-containing protein [Sphingobacteriales bacterium]